MIKTHILTTLLLLAAFTSELSYADTPAYSANAARDTLEKACQQAQEESKLIFLKSGFPECGWCRVFDRYHALPDVQAILGKYYVIAVIDTKYMPDGAAVFSKFAEPGSPSWVIMTADQKVIVSSFSKSGNVGYPLQPDETAYYLKALKTATPSITEAELNSLSSLIKKAAKK